MSIAALASSTYQDLGGLFGCESQVAQGNVLDAPYQRVFGGPCTVRSAWAGHSVRFKKEGVLFSESDRLIARVRDTYSIGVVTIKGRYVARSLVSGVGCEIRTAYQSTVSTGGYQTGHAFLTWRECQSSKPTITLLLRSSTHEARTSAKLDT